MYTLDTTIIYYFNGEAPILAFLREQTEQGAPLFVSAVTEHELYSYPHLTPVEVARIDALLTTLSVIDVDSRIAQLSGQLRASYGIKSLDGEAKLPAARQEIHEALRDLSRRPEPDLTGAIHHAMGALECTTREVTGDVRATLGEILKRPPDLLPRSSVAER